MELIIGILSENLQEPVAAPDISELHASRTGTAALFEPHVTSPPAKSLTTAKHDEHWKTLVLSAKVGEVGLIASRGQGRTKSGESTVLTKFTLQKLVADFTMFCDEAMDLSFSMKELLLEDLRENTKNPYKKVRQIIFFV